MPTSAQETAERDLDVARGLISRLGYDTDALESLNALLVHERARVKGLERQRDGLAQTISIAARETATLALRVAELEREVGRAAKLSEHMSVELNAAWGSARKHEADAARLREALRRLRAR